MSGQALAHLYKDYETYIQQMAYPELRYKNGKIV